MTFGTRLQKRRLELGLTREAVAGAAKTSHQSIWRWEKDLKAPDANTLVQLAKALGCTVGSFFGESPDQPPTKDSTLEAVRLLSKRGELTLEEVAQVILSAQKKRRK